ncbi:CocE/NonD family hydrolase [Peristeroidobacter soli]|uniref:CocE/NonD family hydrolase n=1 Tax=Peristeroidobacter soli TaxID=2497877 RepID=UPI00101C82D3|nr:CocE/NonD family hydrolase [Peristeroidobacter soli]
MSRTTIKKCLLLFVVLMTAAALTRADDAGIVVDYNVMVPMRDGVRLSTDIHRPAGDGRYPVILVRDPYHNGAEQTWVEAGQRWVRRGYVFVHQNVRGRVDSEGAFYPYSSEAADGYDAQQWAAAQSWSNGKVGTQGLSYLASTQWLSAHLRAPALATMVPTMTPFNYYQDVAYPGGALSLGSRLGWAALMGSRTNQEPQRDWQPVLRHLPLQTMDTALGVSLPHWRDWIAHPTYDSYWQQFDVAARVGEIDVPAFNIGGWYDVFLRGTLSSYTHMRKQARSEHARAHQKLLIGPWRHTPQPATALGELDFGPDAVPDLEGLHARWFDHWLKGNEDGFIDEPPVRIFVMGENRWRSEQEWPLARTQYTKYYFHSGGKANGPGGDGVLEARKPTSRQPTDDYVYDPMNPVPTLGGNLMFKPTPAGPYDQAKLGERDDILVFTSAPLSRDLEVTGPVTVTLYAASSARDTDFTAKLVDVHPDGKAYNLADGIIRARYRESFETPTLLSPGRIYEYTIDLWATSNVFKRGHRVRVDISSSNFPRFDRNPNTGGEFGMETRMQMATQTIHHSREYPSHITLPVIPR